MLLPICPTMLTFRTIVLVLPPQGTFEACLFQQSSQTLFFALFYEVPQKDDEVSFLGDFQNSARQDPEELRVLNNLKWALWLDQRPPGTPLNSNNPWLMESTNSELSPRGELEWLHLGLNPSRWNREANFFSLFFSPSIAFSWLESAELNFPSMCSAAQVGLTSLTKPPSTSVLEHAVASRLITITTSTEQAEEARQWALMGH